MKIRRVMPVVVTADLAASREFYSGFLGLEPGMDEPGFLMLRSSTVPTTQVIVASPDAEDAAVLGVDISVEVEDAGAAHDEAVRRGLEIVYPLTDEPWAVRRFFVRDPSGRIVNVASHLEPGPDAFPDVSAD